ncbi:MAG: chromosome segregation protein SMC [Ruminococcaceae bacterium]|nr:chromosome segregation protein SMC [Oscillospiraceae bacterium]
MILKSLEMQGFKSFPDKTVLEFDKGMTSVVGPNGSGKSNIVDAVRWVLGEQSTKNLRGARMEDVIFGGTTVRKAMGFAEVVLRLDNKDRGLANDNDEVVIARRYYRSGESEYRINGEVVRLKDINELFMDTGLGRDGYSIVSQGKIADMVSAKSKERRDILEEAAGISFFRYRRADALRRLTQAEENLVRLRDILLELESRIGPLKSQSEKARKFLVLAEERKTLEISLWLYIIDSLKEKLREQESKIEISQTDFDKAQGELEEIEQKIDAKIARTQEITCEIDDLRNLMSEFDETASNINSKIAVAENTIEHNEESIARIKGEMQEEGSSRLETEKQIVELLEKIEEFEEFESLKLEEIGALTLDVNSLSKTNIESSDKLLELTNKLSKLSEKIADLRVQKSAAFSGREELLTRLEGASQSKDERAELVAKLKKEQDEAKKDLDAANEAVTSHTNTINGHQLLVKNKEEKFESSKVNVEAKRLEVSSLEEKIRMLLELEKNMEGYAGSVKAVLKEAKHGSLSGVHGPLLKLINVKDKYQVAIETALGATVQHIVVKTEADAKRAIKFLKDKNLGRATFLPISTIKGKELQEKGLDDCFGYIDIASNLVEVDKKYAEIVKSQLARTVVVEDLDSAISIAKKYNNRFKLVTLDGQVINAGGSMTGGSKIKNAGLLSQSGAIEEHKKTLEILKKELTRVEDVFKVATEEFAKAKAELDAAESDLITANENKVRSESALKLVEGQLVSVMDAITEIDDEQKNAQSRIEEFERIAKDAEKNEEALIKESETLENEIATLTGSKEELQRQREKMAERSAQLNVELTEIRKDIQSNRNIVERLTEASVTVANKEEEHKNQIRLYEEANKGLLEEIEQLKEKINELKSQNFSSEEKIEVLMKERNEGEAESNRLRQFEREKSLERERLSGELARLTERKANMLGEHEETLNKLYEEYQLSRREAAEIAEPAENPSETKIQLTAVKNKIKAMGSVNVGAIEEYKEVSERFEFMSTQVFDVEQSKRELLKLIEELTNNMATRFREEFSKINKAFGETFVELFGGGKAELFLEDELDILESAIEIKVQPPGKNIQNIDLLSGGEKGLSAIALLFAILKVNPAPFCIFDEVEASLDEVNVTRYAQYVRRMTHNIQFILITHRRGTMEESDILYGVTMQEEGVSKLLELKTAEMAKKLGLE